MQLFSLLHRGQARIYRGLQMALLKRIDDALEKDPNWDMPLDLRSELASIDAFLAKASAAVTKIHDTATKITEGMTTQQLEAQLKAEFIASARTFTDHEWAVLDAVRAELKGKAA